MTALGRTVLEAASWRLASELVRRHPTAVRLIRGHPAGGQSDCLWLLPLHGEHGDVRLNRVGTIQVLDRFDGRGEGSWQPTEWHEYLSADPRDFLDRLESAAGMVGPAHVPSATPVTLTYRVLASIATSAFMSVRTADIQEGYIDTSGYGGGPNPQLERFPIDGERLRPRPDDYLDEPGYRFWIVVRDGEPVLAIDQSDASAWTVGGPTPIELMDLYRQSSHDIKTVGALERVLP